MTTTPPSPPTPLFLFTKRSIYIAALPLLINWNEKRCSEFNILTMDHELLLENYSSAAVNTDEYHYIFEGRKVFEYQTETDLLTQPRT